MIKDIRNMIYFSILVISIISLYSLFLEINIKNVLSAYVGIALAYQIEMGDKNNKITSFLLFLSHLFMVIVLSLVVNFILS